MILNHIRLNIGRPVKAYNDYMRLCCLLHARVLNAHFEELSQDRWYWPTSRIAALSFHLIEWQKKHSKPLSCTLFSYKFPTIAHLNKELHVWCFDVRILKLTPAVRTVGTIFICYRFLFILLMICVLSVVLLFSADDFSKKKNKFSSRTEFICKSSIPFERKVEITYSFIVIEKTKFTIWMTMSICVRAVFFFLFITPKWLKKTKSVNISDRHKIYTIRLRMWRQSKYQMIRSNKSDTIMNMPQTTHIHCRKYKINHRVHNHWTSFYYRLWLPYCKHSFIPCVTDYLWVWCYFLLPFFYLYIICNAYNIVYGVWCCCLYIVYVSTVFYIYIHLFTINV